MISSKQQSDAYHEVSLQESQQAEADKEVDKSLIIDSFF